MTAPYGGASPPIIDDEQLSAYLDGDLPPIERETVRQAIQSDPVIGARYRELAAAVSLLHTLPSPVLRRSFTLTADQLRNVSPTPLVPASMPHTVVTPRVTPLRTARFTPLFGAFGAIAAVLLLMLVSADLVTGGFKATTSSRFGSANIEQVTAAPSAGGIAPAAPAAPRSSNATSTSTNTTAAPAGVTNRSTNTNTGLPLALVRAVEIALGVIAIAGIVAAIQTGRGRQRTTVHGYR